MREIARLDTDGMPGNTGMRRRDFLRGAGGGAVAAATGLLAPRQATAGTGDSSSSGLDRSLLATYPQVTRRTQEWRWGRVRKLMEANNLQVLLVIPGGPFDDPSSYMTNAGKGIVFFPLAGDPVVFVPMNSGAMAVDPLMKNEAAGIESWIRDWRFNQGSPDEIVSLLQERNLASARIGTVGVEKTGHMARRTGNWRPGGLGNFIRAKLPGTTLVELWDPFMALWLVKNDEELAMFRKAGAAMEVAAELYSEACRPGNTLADVMIATTSELIRHGVNVAFPTIGCGPNGGARWGGGITWLDYGLPPPVIRRGDLVGSEIFSYVGQLHAQGQVSVSVGKPSPKVRELADIAREAYEISVRAARAGITFRELAEAAAAPHRRTGAWHLTPRIHTLNPLEGVDAITEGMFGPRGFPGVKERFGSVKVPELPMDGGDLVLAENMTIQFENNAAFEDTYVVLGGNLIVTRDGCEALNDISCRLIVMGG